MVTALTGLVLQYFLLQLFICTLCEMFTVVHLTMTIF